MITIIFGKPGVGKTSLNTFFCELTYYTDHEWLYKTTCERIDELNENRVQLLTKPDGPPIFTNYGARFKVGYEKHYEPYYVNTYYLGLQNERIPVQSVPPNSRIFISEAQRYYNSRKSQSLPDWVSRWYEMHRHFGIEIYMDVQRVKLIDLNIRELCQKFIEVQRTEHERDSADWITKTRWYCREFDNLLDVEDYLSGNSKNYRETVYEYEGNIFESFNSTSCASEFVPAEGEDFKYLTFNREGGASDKNAEYYITSEPKNYRKDSAPPKEQNKQAGKKAGGE